MGGGGAAIARAGHHAQADGRAIRWMVAAGRRAGPGADRFRRKRDREPGLGGGDGGSTHALLENPAELFLGYMLARLGLESYNRAVRLGRVRGERGGV